MLGAPLTLAAQLSATAGEALRIYFGVDKAFFVLLFLTRGCFPIEF